MLQLVSHIRRQSEAYSQSHNNKNMAQPVIKKDATPSPKKSRMRDLTAAEAMVEVDKLNEKVRTFSFSSSVSGESSDNSGPGGNLVRKQDDLLTCLAVMRRLMETSEEESKRLREEKAVITTRISSSLNAVNREVKSLKAELRDQDKRLAELAQSREEQLDKVTDKKDLSEKIKEENKRLRQENEFLLKELCDWKEGNRNLDELRQKLHSSEHEISRAKETIVCMKGERKRLKTEKMDLLNQMKHVYGILEDKECELREFIQNYEQRMRESQEKLERLSHEREVWDRDAQNAKLEIENLKSNLETKGNQMEKLESELSQVRDRLIGLQQLSFDRNNLNITTNSVPQTPLDFEDDSKIPEQHSTREGECFFRYFTEDMKAIVSVCFS